MAGLVPATHVLNAVQIQRRGWPGRARPRRGECRSLRRLVLPVPSRIQTCRISESREPVV